MVQISFKMLLAMAAIVVTSSILTMALHNFVPVVNNALSCELWIESIFFDVEIYPEIGSFMQEVTRTIPKFLDKNYKDMNEEVFHKFRPIRPQECDWYQEKMKGVAENIQHIVPRCVTIDASKSFLHVLGRRLGQKLFSALKACLEFRPQGDNDEEHNTDHNDDNISISFFGLDSAPIYGPWETFEEMLRSSLESVEIPLAVSRFAQIEDQIVNREWSPSRMIKPRALLLRLLRPKECNNYARQLQRKIKDMRISVLERKLARQYVKPSWESFGGAITNYFDPLNVCVKYGPPGFAKELKYDVNDGFTFDLEGLNDWERATMNLKYLLNVEYNELFYDSAKSCAEFIEFTLEAVEIAPAINSFVHRIAKYKQDLSSSFLNRMTHNVFHSFRPDECDNYQEKLKGAAEKIQHIVPKCAEIDGSRDYLNVLKKKAVERRFSALKACLEFRPQGDRDDEQNTDHDVNRIWVSKIGPYPATIYSPWAAFEDWMTSSLESVEIPPKVRSFEQMAYLIVNEWWFYRSVDEPRALLLRLLRPKECNNYARQLQSKLKDIRQSVEERRLAGEVVMPNWDYLLMSDPKYFDPLRMCMKFGPSGFRDDLKYSEYGFSFQIEWIRGWNGDYMNSENEPIDDTAKSLPGLLFEKFKSILQ